MKIFMGAILVAFLIVIILLIVKNKKGERKVQYLICQNEKLKDEMEEIKSMKHDLCNIIQAMGGFIETNDIDGLKDMYNSIMGECTYIKSIDSLNPSLIKNSALFNLINNKYKLAKSNDIKFYVEVNTDTNSINIKDFELCRIIGILIDNAIEAAKLCNEKVVSIKFNYDELNKRNLIIVENSYCNKDLDINEIFKEGYTSKKEKINHGLGLWKAKQIVNLHNNLLLYSKKGKLFEQRLEVFD